MEEDATIVELSAVERCPLAGQEIGRHDKAVSRYGGGVRTKLSMHRDFLRYGLKVIISS
jgi:hypothetical protein